MIRILTAASALFLLVSLGGVSHAKSPSIIGTWHGSGIIQPTGGAKEKTRCRAKILNSPGRGRYIASYKCSSPLGLIAQSVEITKVGSKHYSGTFHNTMHNIRGSVSITLQDNKHSVIMKSAEGMGLLTLNRQ